MYGTNCDTLKRDNEYLRYELDEIRRTESERADREYQARRERERERKEAYEESLCYASNWSEAFENGICRFNRESIDEIAHNDPDMYFTKELEAIQLAQSLYQKEMVPVRERIARITKLLEQQVLNKVAEQVEKEHPKAVVVQNLRENDFMSLVAW